MAYNTGYPWKRRTYKDLVQDLGQSEAKTGRKTPASQVGALHYADLGSEREVQIALGRMAPEIALKYKGLELEGKRLGLYENAEEERRKAETRGAWGQVAKFGAETFGKAGGYDWLGESLGLQKPAITPEPTAKVDWTMGQSYGEPDVAAQPALSTKQAVSTGETQGIGFGTGPGGTNQQPLGGYRETGYASRLATGAGAPTTVLPSAGYSASFTGTPALTSQYATSGATGTTGATTGTTQLTTPALGATTAPAEVGSTAKLATSTTGQTSLVGLGNYVAGAGTLYGWYDTGRASSIEGGINDTGRITRIASGVIGGFATAGPVGAIIGGVGALVASYWGNMFGKG